MKRPLFLAMALIGLGIVSQASADQIVYVTGSTAFRTIIFKALTAQNGVNSVFVAPGPDQEYLYDGSAPNKCNYMLFHGNVVISGITTPVWVNCAWSSTEAGLGSVLDITIPDDPNTGFPLVGSPETWLTNNTAVLTAGYNSGVPTSSQFEGASRQGDLAFADTSILGALELIRLSNVNPALTLKSYGQVGVVTFTWAKNNNNNTVTSGAFTNAQNAWTHLSNINWYQEQQLMGAGQVPADYFTAIFADDGTFIYAIGSNRGSGARANELIHNCGVDPDFGVIQFNIGGGLTTAPTNSLILDINGGTADPWGDEGSSQYDGYQSGDNVAKALNIAGSTAQVDPFTGAGGWIAVAYLSSLEASGIGGVAGNPVSNWLTEDGILESSGAVTTGAYPFWDYENLYGRNGVGGIQDAVGNILLNAVMGQIGNDGNGGLAEHTVDINLNAMHALKGGDYSYPTHF